MIYIIVFTAVLIILFVSSFKGGAAGREIREIYYGNYYAEDGVISEDDVPNSREAFRKCVENRIGLKVSTIISADKKVFIASKDNLKESHGVDSNASRMTGGQLDELGIVPLTEFFDIVGRKIPVIMEIKTSDKYQDVAHSIANEINSRGILNVAVASLNPGILAWFKQTEKGVVRAIISAPASDFKGLSKLEAFMTGNMAYNGTCRPQIMLYRNKPESKLVQFALSTSTMAGTWTITNPDSGKRLEEDKDLIVCRGFMPENPHFKDILDREKSDSEIKSERKKARRSQRQDAKEKIKEEQKAEKTGVVVDKKSKFLFDDEEFGSQSQDEFKESEE